jgi:hypothetical protein
MRRVVVSRGGAAAALLALLAAAGFLALGEARGGSGVVAGDEGTFLAMAGSLAAEGDLAFDARDRARLETAAPGGRRTVILQRAGTRLAYSKPALYPLVAAPFYRVLGEDGLVVVNGAALAAALALAWGALARLGGAGGAAVTLVTFAGASVLPAYVTWQMSDAFQTALALGGLALALATLWASPTDRRRRLDRALDGSAAAWLGGALLGALVAQRLPNALVLVGAVVALVVAGRRGRAIRVLVGALGVLLLAGLLGLRLQGAANPYRAVRASFDAETGYPLAADEPLARGRFTTGLATQRLGWLPDLEPAASAYSALYTLIGRHTGLLAYFPGLLALVAPLVRARERCRWVLVGAAGATALFYVVWWPENYFGGSTFLGNRYFLTAYPLLLFALPALPGRRSMAAAWLLAAGLFASAWVSVLRTVEVEASWQSQSHAYAGLFRLLPFETTGAHIDGVRDLHWYGDVVRLVDPFARLRRSRPRLDGPHELIWVGKGQPAEVIVFTRPDVRSVLFRESEGGVLEIPLARSWRRHALPGRPRTPTAATSIRLAPRAHAVAYGGDAELRRGAFVRDYVKTALPERAVVGTTALPVEVRNMSPYPWFHEEPFAVRIGFRSTLLPVESQVAPPYRPHPHIVLEPLPAKVESGDPVSVVLEVLWPAPGRYHLEVDLYMGEFGWFADRVGAPLAEGIVEVVAGQAGP